MKKSILTLVTSTIISGTIVFSCNSSTHKVEDAAVKVDQASDDLIKAKKEFNVEYNKFKTESEKRMIDNDNQISELKAHKTKLKKEAKADYDKTIADLEKKNSDMKIKIDEYKEDGQDKWESFKREFNHDMDELGQSLIDFAKNNTK